MSNKQPLKLNNSLCPMCGAENSVDAQECEKCGEPLLNYLSDDDKRGLWRDKQLLVAGKRAKFPDRCLKTNEDARGRTYKQLIYFLSPTAKIVFAFACLICFTLCLLSPLIGIPLSLLAVVVTVSLRETIENNLGIQPELYYRKKWMKTICWVGSFTTLLVMIIFLALGFTRSYYDIVFVIGIITMLLFGVVERFVARFVSIKKVTRTHIWLKGVHPDFLADLPEWQDDTIEIE